MLKANGEVAWQESRATFIIMGVGLDLEAITRSIGITPSHTHRVGDLDSLGKPFPHDMWSLDSSLDQSEPLDAHLKFLNQLLKPHHEYIRSLKVNAEIYIYCGYDSDSDQCGFTLSSSALSIFTLLEVPMDVHLIIG